MRRKTVGALILALAVVGAFAMGAAPALAADGCDCHTAVPPTATAAHAPLVVGLDCTVCHVDWTVPHPEDARTLGLMGFTFRKDTTETGVELSGHIGQFEFHPPGWRSKGVDHPGVVVYLQQRVWGEDEFADLAEVTTDDSGNFALAVPTPPEWANYRAVAQGHVGALAGGGTALFKPDLRTTLMTPKLTLKLDGVRDHIVRLGRRVTVTGTVEPADIDQKVTIRVQRRKGTRWVTRIEVRRAFSDTGTYLFRFTPRHLGLLRVQARLPRTDTWMNVRVESQAFRVR